MRNRNIAPWSDLSTMPAGDITNLMMRATRRDVLGGQDRAFWNSVHDPERADRAEALADWWSDVAHAAMFTIEDRLTR